MGLRADENSGMMEVALRAGGVYDFSPLLFLETT